MAQLILEKHKTRTHTWKRRAAVVPESMSWKRRKTDTIALVVLLLVLQMLVVFCLDRAVLIDNDSTLIGRKARDGVSLLVKILESNHVIGHIIWIL